ncbi:MAG: NAD-dependent epimerase/dehydratase family protein [Candidatus Berkelbacteria bacterium]|nr:NAD-dependent epimerase/dehydratase family protein [Candidatus Berkelbacteria bacterium]
MKVLVTGSSGFIGKNLIERLGRVDDLEVISFDKDDSVQNLSLVIKEIDFIFHLAGVNRPELVDEFYVGNSDLLKEIIAVIENNDCKVPILLSSSTQVGQDNDYGKSKSQAEKALITYARQNDVPVFIYRLSNVFGKWCRPNYNSVVATWCHNLTHDLPIQVNDENVALSLVYVDDVVAGFTSHLDFESRRLSDDYRYEIGIVYEKSLAEIRDLLKAFKDGRKNLIVSEVGAGFERALYATYLSYYPTDRFSYELSGHSDDRGTFYEILKTLGSGQFSISTTKPGITRGDHYHNTKNEKFLVIKGEALIKLRQIHNDQIIQYEVSDKKMEVVEMIPGYTHNITNISDSEMVFLIWANEAFDPDNPDTYYLKV